MYRIVSFLLAFAMLTGCGSTPETPGEAQEQEHAEAPAYDYYANPRDAELADKAYMPPPEIEMRSRPTDEADFPEFIDYLVEVSYPRTAEERALDVPVQERFAGVHNIDSIVIAAPGFPADITLEQYEEYMNHFVENGFTSMSVTISNGSDQSVEEVMERARFFSDYIAERPERYRQIRSFEGRGRFRGTLGRSYGCSGGDQSSSQR